MGEFNVSRSVPYSSSVREYFVASGSSKGHFRVAFNDSSSTTTTTRVGVGDSSSVVVTIGTKNMSTNVEVSQAISQAMSSGKIDTLISSAITNISENPYEAVQAVNEIAPEDALYLLQ